MNALTHNDLKMKIDRLILFSSYVLNVPVWMSNIPFWFKIVLAFVTGATTIMAFMNQWTNFSKNYRTLWIVVTINHIFTFIKPRPKQKKNRHRKRGITINKKTTQDDQLH